MGEFCKGSGGVNPPTVCPVAWVVPQCNEGGGGNPSKFVKRKLFLVENYLVFMGFRVSIRGNLPLREALTVAFG